MAFEDVTGHRVDRVGGGGTTGSDDWLDRCVVFRRFTVATRTGPAAPVTEAGRFGVDTHDPDRRGYGRVAARVGGDLRGPCGRGGGARRQIRAGRSVRYTLPGMPGTVRELIGMASARGPVRSGRRVVEEDVDEFGSRCSHSGDVSALGKPTQKGASSAGCVADPTYRLHAAWSPGRL